MRGRILWLPAALVALTLLGGFAAQARSDEVPRISKEELKDMLDSPDVVVLDVRRQAHYDGSSRKVKRAIRESEKDISWASKYPKEKILVLYCA